MEDIAIVGLSFKMPQDAEDETTFWKVLEEKRNLMTDWPESRVNLDSFYGTETEYRNILRSRGAHFLKEDPFAFDASFFSIRAQEAAAMDPQHRLTMEAAYRAFENAGMPLERLRGSRTAVFAASMSDDYTRFVAKDPDAMPRTSIMAVPSILPNRISWYFDLLGPSVHIDTACSSSMVALDLACQSIRNGDSSMALVTGSNLLLGPEGSIILSSGKFLSEDSVSYSFDHRASGYARGEGIIAMIVKPVSQAVRDGDMIRAVIRSTGTNQDGRTPSMTQPSTDAQEQLIRHVYDKAGLDLSLTRFVEAHGTGTAMGDPIEMKAIGRVFRKYRSESKPLYVGSLKANLGHLEGSAGIAGVAKAVLMVEKGIIPPTALFEKMNPDIDAEFYNVKVPVRNTLWPSDGVRRISVNSFGFGGTNAHVVLDDALSYLESQGLEGNHHTTPFSALQLPDGSAARKEMCSNSGPSNGNVESTNGTISNGTHPEIAEKKVNGAIRANGNGHNSPTVPNGSINGADHCAKPCRLLVWTAPDEKSLKRLVEGYQPYFQQQIVGSPSQLEKFAYTLSCRRSHMLWRTYALSDANDVGGEQLLTARPVRVSDSPALGFVFTGQGAQYAGMGLSLLQYPVFAEVLRQADEVFHGLGSPWGATDAIRNGENIDAPEYSQPLCTALQIALVELLKSFNITASAVVGHSSGEIAAAYAAGALSLPLACKIAYFRGQLVGKLKAETSVAGAMLSVNLREHEVYDYLEGCGISQSDLSAIHVACVNSPKNVTLAGPEGVIDKAKQHLEADGIFAQKLTTGVAYHSPAMRAIAEAYYDRIESLKFDEPSDMTTVDIPMVSSVTGKLVSRKLLRTTQYWVDNLTNPVRFSDAIESIVQGQLVLGTNTITDLVELGSHPALRRPVQDTLHEIQASTRKGVVRYAHTLQRSKQAVQSILDLVGQMFCRGVSVSIPAANQFSKVTMSGPFLIDCPEYPFDHSRTYSAEPRFSRDYRLRGFSPRDVLGSRSSDWNPLEPKWRRLLNLDSTPWAKDHVVTGTTLYPGAGMLAMAIEAMKQSCPENRQISGYLVKEAYFLNPLVVGPSWDDTTEVILGLYPLKKSYEKESTWSDIKISSLFKGRWTECFKATVQIQYLDDGPSQVDCGLEKQLTEERITRQFQQVSESCSKSVDSRLLYDSLREAGVEYGPAFQLLKDIRWDGGNNAIGYVDMTTGKHETNGLFHPAVLDCAFHLSMVQIAHPSSQKGFAYVPSRITNAWFAADRWKGPQSSSVQVSNHLNEFNAKSADVEIHVLSDDGAPLCNIKSLAMSAVTNDDTATNADKKLLYGLEWKPQLSLLDSKALQQHLIADTHEKDSAAFLAFRRRLEPILDRFILKTVQELTAKDREQTPEFLKRHLSWMDHHAADLMRAGTVESGMEDEEAEALAAELEELYPSWKLFPAIARNLLGIMRGEVDPLQVGFESGLAGTFYTDVFTTLCDDRFKRLLDLATHEKPAMRILEVGAGTGSTTEHILSAFQEFEERCGGFKFSEYTYTDISPSFFEEAGQRFESFGDRIIYKAFDIERSPESQGFELGAYDMVLASSVIHATANISATLRNVRSLLKPGGHLVYLEIVVPEKTSTNFVFGTFPGWWSCKEEWRLWCPAITEVQWGQILKENGFSDNRVVLRDYESDDCHTCSIMLATREESPLKSGEADDHRVLILIEDLADQDAVAVAQSVCQLLHDSNVEVLSFDSALKFDFNESDIVISLLEERRPFILGLSEATFGDLRTLLQRVQNLIWVYASRVSDEKYAYSNLSLGFIRTLRSENIDKRVIILAIDLNQGDTVSSIVPTYVSQVFRSAFDSASPELEYYGRNGHLETVRAIEEKALNSRVHSLATPQLKHEAWKSTVPLKLSVRSPGFLDSLEFVEDPIYPTDLDPGHIEVEAKAWGLSFRDVFVALGRLPGDDLGYDYAGVVRRVGSNCDGSIKPGDRVCGSTFGCMRTYPRTEAGMVIKIPDDLAFEAAASFISPGITAYYALIDVARLRKGEKVLIHSASGSTGQMAVWIAKMIGAEVFATVGFDEKKDLLIRDFDVKPDHIFYSRNTTFAQGVMRVTDGYGVDVVLNSLAGDGLRASFECMAPYGRFIEIGKADIVANSSLPMACFARNVSFSAVDLYHVGQSSPELTSALLKRLMDIISSKAIHPPTPLHVYPVSEVESAFRYLQSGKNTGRIIVSVQDSDVVPQRTIERSDWSFDKDATYLIAGGLGGLGRAMAVWMASKGARHLVLLSRNGPRSPAALEVVARLQQQGIEVMTPRCDVSSQSQLASVLDECSHSMPPVKGCIQATMQLEDSLFENMTYSQWELSLKSKVQATWNLHTLLPSVDFFIMLSSLSGIYGVLGQGNYSAGCTFQDGMARHRVERGQKAVSLDIGWMRNIGVIAENVDYQLHRKSAANMGMIEDTELMALLDVYCDPRLPILGPDKSQLLAGVVTPGDMLAAGNTPPEILQVPMFSGFAQAGGSKRLAGTGSKDTIDFAGLFKQATSNEDRVDIVVRALTTKLARALSISADDIEQGKQLGDYGVDSLMAVELRNWIARDFGANIAVFEIMGGTKIAAIGELVAGKSQLDN